MPSVRASSAGTRIEPSADIGIMPILTYHSLDSSGSVISVSPELFERHAACLRECGYTGVSLAAALEHRHATGRWPDRSVVITFDDGYENVHRCAAGVLAQHGFAATVFLVTDHVGRLNDWAPPPAMLGPQPMMSWAHARDLQRAGWEIGAHTRTHPDLRRLAGDDADSQIRGSRLDIEQRLAQPVTSFAYPFGFVSEAAATIVEQQFHAACLTELKRATGEPLCALPRVDAYYLRTAKALRRLVLGRLDRYLAFRRLGRRVRAVLRDRSQ